MIAIVQTDGNIAPAGLFTVGAFVGDECRGVGQYVGDKLYMTIYGDVNSSEKISFKAMDNSNQQEHDIVETDEHLKGEVLFGEHGTEIGWYIQWKDKEAEYYRQDFGYWVHKAKIKVIGNIFFNK